MATDANCNNCQYSIVDDLWSELKCKKKQRVCSESEIIMGCSDYSKIGTNPNDPKPEIIVRSGATFYPHISEDGVLSWTNDKGLTNPDPVKLSYGNEAVSLDIPVFNLLDMGIPMHSVGIGEERLFECDTTEIISAMKKGIVGFIIPTNYGNADVYGTVLHMRGIGIPEIVCPFFINTHYGLFVITVQSNSLYIRSDLSLTREQIVKAIEDTDRFATHKQVQQMITDAGYITAESAQQMIDNAISNIPVYNGEVEEL